jgi:uncharacterized protein
MKTIPILGELTRGKTQRHMIKLPGVALAKDEPRPVITVTGVKPGPVLFVNAGVHGGEYPAIEAVIRLSKTLDPQGITGTVILMPVLSLPAFRSRTPFVCPVDNVNPNRVFPGDPNGTYSEQMTHALIHEFVVHADAYVDLHGGDIPEALVPFVICRQGNDDVAKKSKAIAMVFGLQYVLTVSKPVQPAKGLSSYAAAAEKGIPAILAEAGGVGQLQEDQVELLVNGVTRVMEHLGMLAKSQIPGSKSQASIKIQSSKAGETPATTANVEARMSNDETNSKSETEKTAHSAVATTPIVLTKFEWLYTKNAGMWYPKVVAGDFVKKDQKIGTVGDLFGDTLEKIISPLSGTVLFLTINPSVLEKGLLMGIGAE